MHALSNKKLWVIYIYHVNICVHFQGETKVLKLKNLRPQDFANYTCQVSVRNVCDIPDSSVTFRLTNSTSEFSPTLKYSNTRVRSLCLLMHQL